MRFVKPAGEIIPFGAPPDWDEAANGPCGTLPVCRTVEGACGASPFLSYKSNWKPDSNELAKLNAGHVIEVECIHVQPALSINVVPCADPEHTAPARNMEAVRGAVARGWCHEPNTNKELDSDLAEAIAKEVAALFGVPDNV
jgi:hypothetical protein